MNRLEALEYLRTKGKLTKKLEAEFDKLEDESEQEFTEKDVKKVMKKGKIYGDPVVELG